MLFGVDSSVGYSWCVEGISRGEYRSLSCNTSKSYCNRIFAGCKKIGVGGSVFRFYSMGPMTSDASSVFFF